MIKKLFTLLALLILITPSQVLAFTPTQRFQVEREQYFDATDCTTNATPNTTVAGTQGQTYILGDSIGYGLSTVAQIESSLEAKGFTPVRVNADGSRSISGPGAGDAVTAGTTPRQNAFQAAEADKDFIAGSKNIVLEFGTNPEPDFEANLKKLVAQVKGYAPNAKLFVVDIGATPSNLVPGFNGRNKIIYDNASSLGYSVISRYKAIFGADADPLKITPGRNFPGLSTEAGYPDGNVHGAYPELAKAIVDALAGTATATPATPTPTTPATPSTITGLGTVGKSYNGADVWSQAQLDKIKENLPFYLQAAQEFNVPWQMIAVIHNRETSLGKTNPGNGQGIYQFVNGAGGPYPAGPVTDEEFLRQTKFMASRLQDDFVKRNYEGNKGPLQSTNTPDAVVKDTFFSYNGRAGVYEQQAAQFGFNPNTQGYEGSPYVMNKVDEDRDPDINKTTWGQIKTDGGSLQYPANADFGAWVQFASLAGIAGSPGNTGTCGANTGSNFTGDTQNKIAQIANEEYDKWQATGTSDFASEYVLHPGAWCADFVSWVLNKAGSPFTGGNSGGWLISGVSGVRSWFEQNGEFHLVSDSSYTPRVGDVVVYQTGGGDYPDHVNLVVEVNGDKFTTIGGNEGGGRVVLRENWSYRDPSITGFGTLKK